MQTGQIQEVSKGEEKEEEGRKESILAADLKVPPQQRNELNVKLKDMDPEKEGKEEEEQRRIQEEEEGHEQVEKERLAREQAGKERLAREQAEKNA